MPLWLVITPTALVLAVFAVWQAQRSLSRDESSMDRLSGHASVSVH